MLTKALVHITVFSDHEMASECEGIRQSGKNILNKYAYNTMIKVHSV